MHESGMIKGLVKKISDVVNENGGGKVLSVTVWLGALSQISSGHFREHFEAETIGTIAEGSSLEVEVSDDIYDENSQHILLKRVEVSQNEFH